MINRTTKLRWRRRFRRGRSQIEGVGNQAEENLERHFFRRLGRLQGVRRFVISWLLLFIILIFGVAVQVNNLGKYYLFARPAPGGTFVEGILGTFTNANPLYATSNVDNSVSRLIFASLLKLDQNGKLVGDLAEKWTLDEREVVYTVTLKPDIMWHDGYPLTANDVVFTYQSIQNPDAKSPLANSWRGIGVAVKDPRTIEFTLPNALSSFPYSMTNGIVPRHLLSGIPPTQLRSVSFNTQNPVGAGPFQWEAIEVSGNTPEDREQQIALAANKQYHAGRPKLNKFTIRSFQEEGRLLESFNNQELTAMAGLASISSETVREFDIRDYNIPLLSEVMVFFRTTNEFLQEAKVRQALTSGTDRAKIISGLGYPVLPAHGPLLMSQVGYDRAVTQLPYDPVQAAKLLDEGGWKVGGNGIREKAGKPLTFGLYSLESGEYAYVIHELERQWRALGVDVKVFTQSSPELQTTLAIHGYDALVYGINVGADPDVFAYWHSSQASPAALSRTNFSEYGSTIADSALEAGRTRSDPTLRGIKYRPFLEAWRTDAPAIALYQPRFLYVSRGTVFGFDPRSMSSRTDRYANVENWMIREERTSQ